MLRFLFGLSILLSPVLAAPLDALPPVRLVQDGYARLAPFTAVRWVGDLPEIQVDGDFYRLHSLDGHKVEELVSFSKRTYRSRFQKRFSEDLVQLLTEMGSPPGNEVDLVLGSLDGTGRRVERKRVSMTYENRQAARNYNNKSESREASSAGRVQRVQREHARTVPTEWRALFAPAWLDEDRSEGSSRLLNAEQAGQDLDELEWYLEDRFAYLRLRDVDYRGALDALRSSCADGIEPEAFGLQLSKLLALFGDAHSRVDVSLGRLAPPGRSSFLLMDTEQGVACVRADRSGPLDPDYPYLVAIDGVLLEDWLAAAGCLSDHYSVALARLMALRNLRYLGWVAREMGHTLPGQVQLTLSNGQKTRIVDSPVVAKRGIYGAWPRKGSGLIAGDIGYLRIRSMSSHSEFQDELRRAMQEFRGTRGLIIDVRGNGGGSRDALRLLYPYLMDADEQPAVVNLARYRLRAGERSGERDGYLRDRGLYPLTWSGWNAAERGAIRSLSKSFVPAWKPQEGEFSAWHYMLLSPATGEGAYAYQAPVKLLIDSNCFSATDVFASALKGRPNVEVLGAATGGGSGRSRGLRLANSGLSLKLSSMASFQRDGQAYDGVGVLPDIHVEQPAEFHWGAADRVLEQALARFQ